MGRTYSKEEILEMLAAWIREHKKVPKAVDCNEDPSIPKHKTIVKYFGGLKTALEEVSKIVALPKDLNKRDHSTRYSKEEMLQKVKTFMDKHGRFPRRIDFLEDLTLPSHVGIIKKFGSLNKVRELLGLPKIPTKIGEGLESCPILKRYAEELEEGSLETYIHYISHLIDIRDFLVSKNKDLKDITDKDVIQYVKILKERGCFNPRVKTARPNSIRTIRTKLKDLSSFLTWILDIAEEDETDPYIRRGMIKKIKRKIKKAKTWVGVLQPTKRRALTPEEIDQISMSLKDPFLKYMFRIGLNLGLRISEYGKMTLEDLNLDEPFPYVLIHGKGGKDRSVALTDAMVKLFRKQLNLRELDNVEHNHVFYTRVRREIPAKQTLTEYFQKMSEISGVKFTSHQLRYTHGTMLRKKGVPRHVVKERYGHAGEVTDQYLREKLPEEKRILEEKVGIL